MLRFDYSKEVEAAPRFTASLEFNEVISVLAENQIFNNLTREDFKNIFNDLIYMYRNDFHYLTHDEEQTTRILTDVCGVSISDPNMPYYLREIDKVLCHLVSNRVRLVGYTCKSRIFDMEFDNAGLADEINYLSFTLEV